jgi:methylase of polypeptide subunit release factors
VKGALSLAAQEQLASWTGLGVELAHDSWERQGLDNVMPVLDEEQVATWRLLGGDMIAAAARGGAGAAAARQGSALDREREIAFLDVGTGSGFWAILVARGLAQAPAARRRGSGRVLAIDKSSRAVEVAAANARDNDALVEVVREEYGAHTAATASVAAIFMNPPYHLYPPELEASVPLHARGGPHGYELFFSWLQAADRHLAPSGELFFHHMGLGDEEPWLSRRLAGLMSGGPSLRFSNLLPPIATQDFLLGVYGGRHRHFVAETAGRFPRLFFMSGVIVRDGRGERRGGDTREALAAGASWEGRIALHRALANRAGEREAPWKSS